MVYKFLIKKIYILVILSILSIFSVNSVFSAVGATLVGYNGTNANPGPGSNSVSVNLPLGNLYYCTASVNGGSTIVPYFNILVDNSGYSVIGNNTQNSCSYTFNRGGPAGNGNNALIGLTINNYSQYLILDNLTFNFRKSATQSVSFNVNGQNETVFILLAAGSNNGQAGITTVTLPAGCSEINYEEAGPANNPNNAVYAAGCQDLAPGSYSFTFDANVGGPGTTNYASVFVYAFPVFTFELIPSSNLITEIPGKTITDNIQLTQLTGNTPLPVNLSCSTSNTNLGCYLSNNTATPNTTVTLYINSTTSITPGTYTVTINGISENNATNSTTITVNVPQELINVSSNPSSITLSPGSNSSTIITASDNYGDNLNISASCPSPLSCSFSGQNSVIIPSGGSTSLDISVPSSASQGLYIINVTATDIVTNKTQVNVTVVIENINIALNQTSGNLNSGQSISIQVSGTDNLGNNLTLRCLSPSSVTCSPAEVNITSGGSQIFTITAPNVNSYQQYNITFLGIDQVTGLSNISIFTLNVYPYPIIYIISPNNNTKSNYYGLNLTFYTNYPNVNITINGNKYNINVTPGINNIYLRYNNSSNGLPSLYNIIPNGGNISIELSTESYNNIVNSTGIYIYQLPEPVFNVSYTSPTPSNGYISNLWLLQIYGNVYDNTEGIDYCNIQFLNQSNNQWVTISSSTECNDVFYNGLLQEYSKYNGQYYQLYYRIYGYNNYGLYNITPEQVIYFSPNSQNITVINNSLTNNQINNIIQGSINNNIPIVVFPQGIYLVNLNINPQGKNIELLGSGNVLFEPANPGLPVINIESSNVNITNINIQTNLFALRLTNGTVNIYNSNINSGLFGIQVENPSILNIYNSTINGNIGAIYGTGTFQNSTIENSNIQSSVWGIYDNNPENIIINNNNINANIFGIDLDGNAINNTINNNNVDSNIFGIKLNNGYNNYIENNNIDSNIFGIDLGSGNNYILNDLIKVGSVFGLYETNNNYINNVTAYGGIFGLNIYGNASNIYDYNSQLGVAINNNGTINNLTVSTGTIDINYIGSGFINNANSFASSIINNTIQYNFASGILLIGSLNANITFTNIPTGNYIIEKIVGGSGNIISTNNTFSPSGFGIYALYYS
ncbi:hypothetical protein MJ1_0451 [Nanobdella aerobiophila]|uniref:Right handed beta helix domain-containing protein n=1 Tax=Nanobdella aerobiophila TaxID=2586965 RepID=A0A915WSS1_9ARCH|nr:right-handed parallel beta-helix repeat-containing protein [Nanobdella aerobiophila]BBL45610.1 hypothetical protein MJ1_0451 [Nanobdella aerobiophila]